MPNQSSSELLGFSYSFYQTQFLVQQLFLLLAYHSCTDIMAKVVCSKSDSYSPILTPCMVMQEHQQWQLLYPMGYVLPPSLEKWDNCSLAPGYAMLGLLGSKESTFAWRWVRRLRIEKVLGFSDTAAAEPFLVSPPGPDLLSSSLLPCSAHPTSLPLPLYTANCIHPVQAGGCSTLAHGAGCLLLALVADRPCPPVCLLFAMAGMHECLFWDCSNMPILQQYAWDCTNMLIGLHQYAYIYSWPKISLDQHQ